MIRISANTPELQEAISSLAPGEVHEITLKLMVSENSGNEIMGEVEPGSFMTGADQSGDMELPDEILNDEVEAVREMSTSAAPKAAIQATPPAPGDLGEKKMPPAIYK